eukprot:CAMPEP_0184328574 /NCGR_PEP_ID=MMETSP1049-20130417/143694_1 /TAXON_ID=77928 /ORGANISM="Proteomonas sulcata, Strain CCMP704" /LENGTH=331 /DNA_ID=CAMNT_0026650893 /DNA_START=1233 /DNA_END=2229 /DNA_ORIENTATION=+
MALRKPTHPKTQPQTVNQVLLGLYPPENRAESSQIKIESMKKEEDTLTGPSVERCPRLGKLREMLDDRISVPDRYKSLIDSLTPKIAPQGQNFSWVHVSEIGVCHRAHGLELPWGLTDTELDLVTEYNSWRWNRRHRVSGAPETNYTEDEIFQIQSRQLLPFEQEYLALSIGQFAKEVIESIDRATSKRQAASQPKMRIFSGHDSTLVPFLTMLKAHDSRWPPYGAWIELELWKGSPAHYSVHMRYEGKPTLLFPMHREWVDARIYGEFRHKGLEFIPTEELIMDCKRDPGDTSVHVDLTADLPAQMLKAMEKQKAAKAAKEAEEGDHVEL